MKTRTRARVQMVIDLDVSDTWDPSTSLEQVFKQAKESAEDTLRQLVVKPFEPDEKKRAQAMAEWVRHWSIISMKVSAITTEEA